MKKTTFIQLFATIALGGAMITACSGDDDDNTGGTDYSPASSKIGTTGKALAGINGMLECTYGTDGVLQKATYTYKGANLTININGNKETITYPDASTATWNYDYNSKGYVIRAETNDNTYSSIWTFSYSNDRLTQITHKRVMKNTGEEHDVTYSITWSGGRITSVNEKTIAKNVSEWEGRSGEQTETITYTYPATPVRTATAQPTLSLANIIFIDISSLDPITCKLMLGQMGKGMEELPSRIEDQWTVVTNGTNSGTVSHDFSYGLNSDGTIAYETIDGTRYNYSYTSNFGAQLSTALPQTETMIPMATAAKETSTGLRHYEPIR